jgi:quinoprotein glucose dehydrogenase
MLLYGAGLAAPGGLLAWLGGSPFYLAAGLTSIAVAVLLWRASARAIPLYALLLVTTLTWAVWECGDDGWALLPRTSLPILLGAWLLTPWAHRSLDGNTRLARISIGAACLIGAGLIGIGLLPPASLAPAAPAPASAPPKLSDDGEWTDYGRDKAGTRFSPLAQVTRDNVSQLQLAWTYRVGVPSDLSVRLEVTPLKIGERVYLCAGNSDVIALDSESGKLIWRWEAKADATGIYSGVCRGVAYYHGADASSPCPERIITTALDRRLVALNARDGTPCQDFGENGQVSLDLGMGSVEPGYYFVTSAPQIVRGNVVLGGWVTDGQHVGEPSGVIRAFNAVTGKLAWAWDMGRPSNDGEPQRHADYTRGTPNSWAPISADESLGLVYLPTGNATPDYVGSHRRSFDDAYSSSVVALDAETGALRWSFQTTHHDLWDYDVASQPTLVDLQDGTLALLQPTKRGELFLLDRRTGKPLAPVEERPVPATQVAGEHSSPTQAFSVGMPSFAGSPPSESRMWGITPFDQLWCRIKYREARYDGTLTPVGLDRPTIVYPGYLGGMEWGGVSIDLDRGLAVVNSNQVVNFDQLITREDATTSASNPFRQAAMATWVGPWHSKAHLTRQKSSRFSRRWRCRAPSRPTGCYRPST